MIIGTALGLSNLATIVLSIALAFVFGYALTSYPLLRAGDEQHDRVVDDLHGRDRERVGGERDRHHHREREPGAQQRDAGQRVAERKREHDRERDRGEVREAERGGDGHPRDLADRTPGEAVKRGADRDAGERRAPGGDLVMVVSGLGVRLHAGDCIRYP